jgi:hypothetical protein
MQGTDFAGMSGWLHRCESYAAGCFLGGGALVEDDLFDFAGLVSFATSWVR